MNKEKALPEKSIPTASHAETSRRNGRRGKGPVTLAGKAKSSQNAVRHGLFASVIPGGRLPVFADRRELVQASMRMAQEFGVTTVLGRTLVESLAMDMLRLRHVRCMELAILDPGTGNDRDIDAALFDRDSASGRRSDEENDMLMRSYAEAESCLSGGRQLNIRDEALPLMTADLWRVMNEARRTLEYDREHLRELDEEIAVGEGDTSRLQASRAMALESVATDEEDMRATDREVFLVSCEADIASLLSGGRRIAPEQRQRWTELMGRRRKSMERMQQQVAIADSRLASYRRRHLLASVDKLDTLNRLSEYENHIRRSISKTLAMIREVESVRGVIDVPE
jgi:hypothetical protein